MLKLICLSLILLKNVHAEALTPDNDDPLTADDTCVEVLKHFSASCSEFTACAVNNARPIRLCEVCVLQYLDVLSKRSEIMQISDQSGHLCKDKLINRDRLEVVEGAYMYVQGLWSKAVCDDCFDMYSNGTLNPEPNNATRSFQNLFSETMVCILEATKGDLREANESNACTVCAEKYSLLNKYYDNLKTLDPEGQVCMDIVDSMNLTRTKWSRELHCYHLPSPQPILFVSTGIVALIPIIFYVTSKIFATRILSRISHQKRLAEHVASSSSRTES